MEKTKINEGKVQCEKEAKQVLKEIGKLNHDERVGFFYFYTMYGNKYLFHTYLKNIKIEDDIVETEDSLYRDYGIEYTSNTKKSIILIYNKFIKDNRGTCANYFGAMTLLLTYDFLVKSYKKLFKEADIFYEAKKLNETPIDLVCENKVFDFVESKFTISDIKKIQLKIDELKKIISKLKGGKEFLSTLDFKSKNKIMIEIDNYLPVERIYSSEDILEIELIKD